MKRREFGQHILVDNSIIKKILESVQIEKNDIICEMGTGTGELTKELVKYGKKIESFEIDYNMYKRSKILEKKYNNLRIIHQDLLKNNTICFDVFISNIPYSRSRDVFLWLATKKFKEAVIMIQKEFSDKITIINESSDKLDKKKYRAISAICQYRFNIDHLFDVSKESFIPQPRVQSSVIKVRPKNDPISKEEISKINFLFSFKNKKINHVLKKSDIDYKSIFDDRKRVRDLDPYEIISIARHLNLNV